MTEFHAGDSIAGYTVSGVCGKGSYGEVYRVTDSLGAELALKIVPSGRTSEREINALLSFRACRHPNLLTILQVGKLPGGRVFYTMDLADPQKDTPEYSPDTLSARMTGGPFPPEEAERILRELLSGLNELHRAHLLHRDIKPANILFLRGRAVLADIGLVTPDASASLIGTPDYLPPELLKSHRAMTAADDCYALGLVLYCMLTGEPPKGFPSVPKTLREPSALRLLKIAEKACTPPGFPNAAAFLEGLERPVLSGKKRGAWKWFIGGAIILMLLAALAVWRFAVMPGETYTPGNTAIPHQTPALPDSAPGSDSPRTYQRGSSIHAPQLEEDRPAAPAPVVYAPEVAALLKKYQLTEAEEAERERRMLPYLDMDSERAKQTRQQIVAITGTSREADRMFEQEMAVKILLERFGADTPTSSELTRLENALRRRKQAYTAPKP